MRDLKRQVNKIARTASGDYDYVETFFADNEVEVEKKISEIKDKHGDANGLIVYFQRDKFSELEQESDIPIDGV